MPGMAVAFNEITFAEFQISLRVSACGATRLRISEFQFSERPAPPGIAHRRGNCLERWNPEKLN